MMTEKMKGCLGKMGLLRKRYNILKKIVTAEKHKMKQSKIADDFGKSQTSKILGKFENEGLIERQEERRVGKPADAEEASGTKRKIVYITSKGKLCFQGLKRIKELLEEAKEGERKEEEDEFKLTRIPWSGEMSYGPREIAAGRSLSRRR